MVVPSQCGERQTGKIKCPEDDTSLDAVGAWGSSQLGLESSQAGGLRAEMELGGEYKGLLPPILVWLSSVGNPRTSLGGGQEAPLTVGDPAPQNDVGGGHQIEEGKAVSSALPSPIFTHPAPSPVGQALDLGCEGDRQKIQGACRSLRGHGEAKAGCTCASVTEVHQNQTRQMINSKQTSF